MINFIKNYKKNRGYTLVETLFYIALFAVLGFVVINALIVMTKSFRETTVQTDIIQMSGIMERMSREIRQSYAIGSINATTLNLNTKDDLGNNKTVEFLLSGNNLQLLENSVLTGNLNTPNIQITALSFTQISTTKGTAIKISFSVKSARDSVGRVESFYDTVILRGDY